MSLFDYLNNDVSTGASSLNAQTQLLLQQAAARAGTSTSTATAAATGSVSTQSASSVLITTDAVRANAEAADAKTDAADLADKLRATLDKGDKSAALSSFSGRALAVIALDDNGRFSPAEKAAAKTELRERDRAAALAFLNSGELTAAGLKSFGQQQLAARAQMSAEEQQLRASDPDLR